jgi:hypothetical protein
LFPSHDPRREEVERLREVVQAVAHVGVDFGYGKYELEDRTIHLARQLVTQTPEVK